MIVDRATTMVVYATTCIISGTVSAILSGHTHLRYWEFPVGMSLPFAGWGLLSLAAHSEVPLLNSLKWLADAVLVLVIGTTAALLFRPRETRDMPDGPDKE